MDPFASPLGGFCLNRAETAAKVERECQREGEEGKAWREGRG